MNTAHIKGFEPCNVCLRDSKGFTNISCSKSIAQFANYSSTVEYQFLWISLSWSTNLHVHWSTVTISTNICIYRIINTNLRKLEIVIFTLSLSQRKLIPSKFNETTVLHKRYWSPTLPIFPILNGVAIFCLTSYTK